MKYPFCRMLQSAVRGDGAIPHPQLSLCVCVQNSYPQLTGTKIPNTVEGKKSRLTTVVCELLSALVEVYTSLVRRAVLADRRWEQTILWVPTETQTRLQILTSEFSNTRLQICMSCLSLPELRENRRTVPMLRSSHLSLNAFRETIAEGKGKVYPRTGREGPEGEQIYSSTL